MQGALCVGCGDLVDRTEEGRCPACLPAYREEKTRRRAALEPWRRVYSLPEWQSCLAQVFGRDGHRCRVVEHGARCTETTELQGHHHPRSLSELYSPAMSWRAFVKLACSPALVITTCSAHNNALDAERRRRAAAAEEARPASVPGRARASAAGRVRKGPVVL